MTTDHSKRRAHDRGGQIEAPRKPDLQARYERALILARGSEMIGDKVEAERLYQQADHYRRLLNNQAA